MSEPHIFSKSVESSGQHLTVFLIKHDLQTTVTAGLEKQCLNSDCLGNHASRKLVEDCVVLQGCSAFGSFP